MTKYTGQITLIIEAGDECVAQSRLMAIARHFEEDAEVTLSNVQTKRFIRFTARNIDEHADGVVLAEHNDDVEDYEAIQAQCRKSLESGPALHARFDDYEIQPCRRYIDADEPGLSFVEPCEASEADFWTLCGHVSGEGVHAVGDFHDRKHAAEVYSRITGVTFTSSYKADARLRVMHAGPKLLDALMAASDWINAQLGKHRIDIQSKVQQAIAEATGRAV